MDGKEEETEGKIGGGAENLPNQCSAEQRRNVRLRNPFFLTLLIPAPRTRWQSMQPKFWLPCRAQSTRWALPAPLSVSTHSIYLLFRKGFERKLEIQQRSCKLDFLCCRLIVFVVSNRLKLCQACVGIAVAGSYLQQLITAIMLFIMCL